MLDRPHEFFDSLVPPAQPVHQPLARGLYTIIVNANGTADPKLTRISAMSGDTNFHNNALRTLRSWRFKPPLRNGAPVRSGFELAILTDNRSDETPSRLQWRYVHGASTDSLIGRWIALGSQAPYSTTEADTVYAATLRRLSAMRVLMPSATPYCVSSSSGDSALAARVAHLGNLLPLEDDSHTRQVRFACDAQRGVRQLTLVRIAGTENGRAVLHLRGDSLGFLPHDLSGRSWRGWEARCVAHLLPGSQSWADCDVNVDRVSLSNLRPEVIDRWSPAPRADSVQLRVIAMTLGSFQQDTLYANVLRLPEFDADIPREAIVRLVRPNKPQLQFKLMDLRPSSQQATWFGRQLAFRINVAGAPENLLPIVLVKTSSEWRLTAFPRSLGNATWEYHVGYSDDSGSGYPADTEVFIHLVVRPP